MEGQPAENKYPETGSPQINPAAENTGLQFSSRIDLLKIKNGVDEIRQQLGKVIIGQEEFIELLIVSIFANGHSLIEGVPGVAKTVTAKLLARTMDTGFSRLQFTPDMMPSDILGTSVFDMKRNEFEFKK